MNSKIREGELYSLITVDGEAFEIRYGYYEDKDRFGKYNDPIPIYPDFLREPRYNKEGYPFVTEMQDVCEHFEGKLLVDICCGCSHFQKGKDLIGVCRCEKKKLSEKGESL